MSDASWSNREKEIWMALVSLTVRWMQNQAGNSADHRAEVSSLFQIHIKNVNEKKETFVEMI